MKSKIAKLGGLEINITELRDFIVEAKKNCYAGNVKKIIMLDDSKKLEFQKENFHYTDNYSGYSQFQGVEIVRWKKEYGRRVWQMSYSGGMFPEYINNKEITEKTFSFLKEMLSKIKPNNPFRGPEKGRDYFIRTDKEKREWKYRAVTEGDLTNFKGEEEINTFFGEKTLIEKTVFSVDYIGGLVISK